ncbi:MAG: aminoglycoside phosphotransferase family protein [Lachnospiraceae bacterium]|nr:aminoglycoside phosphotransferase family protein [Lachnospiraceae bacterium]
MNVYEYLHGHDVTEIKVGQSGANVYEIDGRYVLKHMIRQRLKEELFATYTREALFYQNQMTRQRIYLPVVLQAETSKNEILILMKKYCRLERYTINAELIQKITKSLAALHTDVPPSFICKDQKKAEPLSDQIITECLFGWKSVLAEHPGSFSESPVNEIASIINNLIAWHDTEDRVLIHGDFHWDNLLEDENGNILLCDWQGVNLGGASGDLSFFLSRLGGDGIQIDAVVFLDYYVNAIRELSGKQIQLQDIIRHMSAANVITSFLFWHQYLHGSSEERVRDIYSKMTKDFKDCNL